MDTTRAVLPGRTRGFRTRTALPAAAAALLVAVSGCAPDDGGGSGRVTLVVNGQPEAALQVEREIFDADVAEFEELHPDIDIEPREGFMDPETFQAKLAGGQLEDVFYVYFTDPATLIERGQAADITEQAEALGVVDQLQPGLLDVFRDGEGRLYGLPTANYSMGLVYNRTLFEEAGLDPDDPPATWEEVREAAEAVSALDEDYVGFGELSTANQGGWHFNAWMNSLGAEVVDRDSMTASVDNAEGRRVLETLHAMRWEDGSMGERQLLEFEDLQRMMGAGTLGMYVGAPDNLKPVVDNFEGDFADYGLAPMPEQRGTLIGGEGYMFNPQAAPEQIEAGLAWLSWKYLNPDRFQDAVDDALALDSPVGLPMAPTPDIWTGDVREAQLELKEANANVPLENYQSFVDAQPDVPGFVEPPQAQQVYAVLDTVMQAVLTREDADVDALLATAEEEIDAVLGG
ncbi:ABC transporter substrate-binding protein [Nocardiopsis deserti]|uniref:ABC transporter substrate-binding protein n=1 Tax=Nocardiopsis deserti TaxID=2605988 RepID=UPI00123B3B61|nr:extracellular solute-binding protein [Nocardiopsis deserti]